MSIPFLDSATVRLRSLPKYKYFTVPFCYELDYGILHLLYNTEDERITDVMKQLMESLLQGIQIETGKVWIKHKQSHLLGRFYGDEKSIIPMSRYIKHTVFDYCGIIDLDMVKAHPSIALSVFANIPNAPKLEHIRFYVENFEKVKQAIIDYHQIDDQENKMDDDYHIKMLFSSMLYGGGFDGWKEEIYAGNQNKGIAPIKIKNEEGLHHYAQKYKEDCKALHAYIIKNNPALVKKLKDPKDKPYETNCRAVSYWFGIIENHILYTVYEFLVKRGLIEDYKCALEYDGLCFKPLYDFDRTLMADSINAEILKKTGLQLKMKFKDHDNKRIMTDIIECRKTLDMTALIESEIKRKEIQQQLIFDSDNSFEGVARRFERNHAKIINRGLFIKCLEDDVVYMSKALFTCAYEHMVYTTTTISKDGEVSEFPSNFIKPWMNNNPNQRCYDDVGCFPNPTKCPPRIFNTWIPFAMERITEYKEHKEGLDMIRNHIKILCNNDLAVSSYFEKWIAQMIQYPEIKSICPVLISKEGAGKGTLLQLFSKMFGSTKIFETSDPARDVWGEFNGRMTTGFLVNLNELSKKDTIEAEGRMKALITDSTLYINSKNVNQFPIQSYHRFIITTNKEDPVNTTKDDRRKLIIRSSDELCGNKEYFAKLYDLLDDVNVIKTCYEYFKSIADMDSFGKLPIPLTSYQKDMMLLTMNPIELWLKYYIERVDTSKPIADDEDDPCVMTTEKLFKRFIEWCDNYGKEYDKISCVQFAVRLQRLNLKGISTKSTKKCNMKVLDIKILSKELGIGCLVSLL
jgi:hypothetical protein